MSISSQPLFSSEQPPKSLCILRLSAIGDVTHALAVVQEISRYYPNCQITWIVGKAEYALLSALTDLNLIVYDKKAGWRGMLKLWQQLKHQRFDALLNMQTALRASVLSLGIKAKYKIGFGTKRSREKQHWFVNQRVEDPANPHVLNGFMAFAEKIGVPSFQPKWSLNIPTQSLIKTQNWLAKHKKNLVITPCSSKAEKDWLVESYVEVAKFADQQGFNILVCGSPAQREIKTCEKITALLAAADIEITNLCGQTSLVELTALIKQADLLIAPDSGPAHIATMVDTPVIGLYAYHNPLRTAPYYSLEQVVSVYVTYAQKEFNRPSSQLPWATKLKTPNLMAEIKVKDVIEKMQKFLS